jgi:hypothetical protein
MGCYSILESRASNPKKFRGYNPVTAEGVVIDIVRDAEKFIRPEITKDIRGIPYFLAALACRRLSNRGPIRHNVFEQS